MAEPRLIHPISWLHSPSCRSKRSETVKSGYYVLEYEPTGRFYIHYSDDVSKTVDKALHQLKLGKHPCRLLNELYSREPVIRVFEFPLRSKKGCVDRVIDLIKQQNPDYLCLNKDDHIKPVRRKRKTTT